MASVLVAYATKYGSTQEVAGVVATTLAEQGVEADLRPAHDVASLDGYSAVVVGAALYNHRWHHDAVRFISQHRTALSRVPVAIFAVGPVNDDPQEFDSAREQLDRILSRWEWLSPASLAVFGGRFDPARLRFPGAARVLAKVPATDAVDPPAISAWAHSLPEALALRQPVVR